MFVCVVVCVCVVVWLCVWLSSFTGRPGRSPRWRRGRRCGRRRRRRHRPSACRTESRATNLTETAGYDEDVRWCGEGAARPFPTRLWRAGMPFWPFRLTLVAVCSHARRGRPRSGLPNGQTKRYWSRRRHGARHQEGTGSCSEGTGACPRLQGSCSEGTGACPRLQGRGEKGAGTVCSAAGASLSHDTSRIAWAKLLSREKDQIEDNLPQPSMSRCPEDDPRMRHAAVGRGEEVARDQVVVVIRQRGLDVGESHMRKRPHDLVGRTSLFHPKNDVLDADSRSPRSGACRRRCQTIATCR